MSGAAKLQGRLLILDDDALTAQTVERIARFIGMEARYTTEPQTFFQLLEDWHPDVIALDLIMPEMDGIEVLSSLAKQDCKADIILTSGVDQRVLESARRSADENGLKIIGLLSKPFSAAQLRELLARKDTPTVDLPSPEPQPSGAQNLVPDDEELISGIELGQLSYFYQPKVQCTTGMIKGFEALARWHHPRCGWQSPGNFIPQAEQLGVITALSRQLFESGVRWFAELRRCIDTDQVAVDSPIDFDRLTLSLNVSALSLTDFSLFTALAQFCEQHQINHEQIILEVTENCAMEDPAESLRTLTRLRMLGFQLAIDDFGTGYSSMLQLVRMPFSELKIDRSFVSDAAQNAESRAVICSMVELGGNLGMTVVAEGVEQSATLEFLRQIGCDMVQGYLISRPLPPERVFPWLLEQLGRVEAQRETEISRLGITNQQSDPRFDRVTRLANRLLRLPVVAFTAVEGENIWVKSALGIEPDMLPRSAPLFSQIIRTGSALTIEDLERDPRFNHIQLLREDGKIKGFIGMPVLSPAGFVVGVLTVMGIRALQLNAAERSRLKCLTKMLEMELAGQVDVPLELWSGLYNWEQYFKRAELSLGLCQQCALPVCLMIIRTSDIEQANTLAKILASCCRGADLPGRIGEQEFILLVVDCTRAAATGIIERIITEGQQRLAQNTPARSFTSGVSNQEDGGYRLETLVAQARKNLHGE